MSAYSMRCVDCGRIEVELFGHESGVDRERVAWIVQKEGGGPGEIRVDSRQEAQELASALLDMAGLLPDVTSKATSAHGTWTDDTWYPHGKRSRKR